MTQNKTHPDQTHPSRQDRTLFEAVETSPLETERPLYERLRNILAGAVESLQLKGASLYLLNQARDAMHQRVWVDSTGREKTLSQQQVAVGQNQSLSEALNSELEQPVHQLPASSASVELRVQDKPIGLLSVEDHEGTPPGTTNMESLRAFASQAAFAIEAAHAAARWQHEAHHERTLFEVSRAISSALDPNQVLDMVARLMARGVGSDASAVYVLEADLHQFKRRAFFGISPQTRSDYDRIPISSDDPVVVALTRNRSVEVGPAADAALARDFAAAIDGRKGVAVPVLSKGNLNAVAVVALKESITLADHDDVELLAAIAGQAAVAIENATLYDAQNRAVTELAALYAVSQALAASPTLNDRLNVVAQSIMAVSGVSRCGVFLIENAQARGHVIVGVPEEDLHRFQQLRLGLSERETAMMAAIKEGRPTVISAAAGKRDGYMAEHWGIRRMLAVPLIYEGRTVGLAAADEPYQEANFTPGVLKVAAAIGEQAALAVQTARLFEQTRQHAEELGVLFEAGQALSSEMELDEVLDRLQQQVRRLNVTTSALVVVPRWDGKFVISRDSGAWEVVRGPSSLTQPVEQIAVRALETDEPDVHSRIPVRNNPRYPRLLEMEEDHANLLCIPLRQRGQTVGVMAVMAPASHDFTTAEVRLVGSLASLAASAVSRAQLYERERRIAETFQRSFLPDVPEEFNGYRIAHQYAAALEEAHVGGDFYDVFALDETRLALVMGDVSGKGLNAAVHTAMAKYLLRAYIFEQTEPETVLSRVNNALCRYTPGNMFITLFLGILDTANGVVTYANAGHELPLLWSSDVARFRTLACTGPALGFLPNCTYIREEMPFSDGDRLILYTDGITEARNEQGFFEIEGIRRSAGAVINHEPAAIAEAVETAAREHAGGRLSDDVALVVLDKTAGPG